MITDAILNFFGVLVDAGLNLLPTISFPTVPWDYIVAEITYYNSILPVFELYMCINVFGAVSLCMFAYYSIMWVLKRLTFSG